MRHSSYISSRRYSTYFAPVVIESGKWKGSYATSTQFKNQSAKLILERIGKDQKEKLHLLYCGTGDRQDEGHNTLSTQCD